MNYAYEQRLHAAPTTHLNGLLAVHAMLGRLMDAARGCPGELLKMARWTELYDANDEMRKGDVPNWIKTAYRTVITTLDEIRPILMAEPQHPGYLHELLRAYIRLTRIIREVRAGRLV